MKPLSTISESHAVEHVPSTAGTTNDYTTTNNDTSSVYHEFIEFLQSTRADLRLEATKAVLHVVSDRNQVLSLLQHGVLLPLLRIVSDHSGGDNELCAQNALKAILFMSSSVEHVTNQCVEELINEKAVPRLIEVVMTTCSNSSGSAVNSRQQANVVNLALGVLANLTRTEIGLVELLGKTLPDEAVNKVDPDQITQEKPTMTLLLDRFLSREYILEQPDFGSMPSHEWDTLSADPYQHFAAILMNATQLESGRRFVLRIPQAKNSKDQQPKSVFEILLQQLYSPNPVRRRGVSGMIRNCCLEKEASWWMINVAKMVTPVLYPLAGPEELDWDEKQGMDPDLWIEGPDKTREIDEGTRQNLVDSILLLCASGRQTRKSLRLARTYVILKYADMVEESEVVSDRISECVQFLRRDEEGTDEGSSDRLIEEEYTPATKLKLLSSSQVSAGVDYDDVD